jgi:hypothetical protein
MDDSQAFTLMMLAESKGLHPIQAMERYHIIMGRPSMKADAMQAEFQRRGGCVRWVKRENDECVVELWHPTLHPDHLFFAAHFQDLVDKGVATAWNKDKQRLEVKDMYVKFPRQMLSARAISEGVRAVDPGVVVGIYTPEEMSDFDSPRGESSYSPPAREEASRPIPEPLQERAVSAAKPTPYSEPLPRPGSFREWLEDECKKCSDNWRNICLIEGKEFKKTPVTQQVGNHLVKLWISTGALEQEHIETNGKRDKLKVAAALNGAWQSEDQDEVKDEVIAYLRSEVLKLAEEAGIEMGDDNLMARDAPAETAN